MEMENVIQISRPAPDSHYRLRNCRCQSDNVSYVQYEGDGAERWRVLCFDCGNTVDKGCTVKHEAQVAWNEKMAAGCCA